MNKNLFNIVEGDYLGDGFTIVESQEIDLKINTLTKEFKKFKNYFDDNTTKNRNILKRFSDSYLVNNFFSSNCLLTVLKELFGLKIPVFCGPIVSHFTSNNKTGMGYGLPYHQDWPRMASSKNSLIIWVPLRDCNKNSHSIAILKGLHKNGLLLGNQSDHGYKINITNDMYNNEKILTVKTGQILFMSSFLPHKTYVNPNTSKSKISLSRRVDDFGCKEWGKRDFFNAYSNQVDRQLYLY